MIATPVFKSAVCLRINVTHSSFVCGNHFVSLKLYLCFAKKPIITADLYWVSGV